MKKFYAYKVVCSGCRRGAGRGVGSSEEVLVANSGARRDRRGARPLNAARFMRRLPLVRIYCAAVFLAACAAIAALAPTTSLGFITPPPP